MGKTGRNVDSGTTTAWPYDFEFLRLEFDLKTERVLCAVLQNGDILRVWSTKELERLITQQKAHEFPWRGLQQAVTEWSNAKPSPAPLLIDEGHDRASRTKPPARKAYPKTRRAATAEK